MSVIRFAYLSLKVCKSKNLHVGFQILILVLTYEEYLDTIIRKYAEMSENNAPDLTSLNSLFETLQSSFSCSRCIQLTYKSFYKTNATMPWRFRTFLRVESVNQVLQLSRKAL